MKTRTLILPTAAAVLATLAVAAPAATAQSAAPRIVDVDADLRFDGRLYLEVETAGASRVHFTYAGKTVKAKRGRLDREDGTRDFSRVVKARNGDGAGSTVTFQVRACKGGECVTRTGRELLEREDDD